ncbi:MAG: hypothetical protein A6F71_03335 [Cycloclasticus sp. symbiont of Poecilosclerida sp. M]|nr:MAG: hypothetical protein A6F71_03335 [Cycloclasticus sp. symbiont of Poecilosclerida sp. M]
MPEVKQVRSVMLPLKDATLLLPHSALAEIVPEREITGLKNSAKWVAGTVSWNNGTIPLVLMEQALGLENSKVTSKHRLIIVRCLGEAHGYRYLAIRTTGVPKLIQASDESVKIEKKNELKSEFVSFSCDVNGQLAFIPNMEKIEAKVVS